MQAFVKEFSVAPITPPHYFRDFHINFSTINCIKIGQFYRSCGVMVMSDSRLMYSFVQTIQEAWWKYIAA